MAGNFWSWIVQSVDRSRLHWPNRPILKIIFIVEKSPAVTFSTARPAQRQVCAEGPWAGVTLGRKARNRLKTRHGRGSQAFPFTDATPRKMPRAFGLKMNKQKCGNQLLTTLGIYEPWTTRKTDFSRVAAGSSIWNSFLCNTYRHFYYLIHLNSEQS